MINLTLGEKFDDDPSDGKYFYLKEATTEPTENNCGNSWYVEKYTTNGWYRAKFEIKALIFIEPSTVCPGNNSWIHYR